MARRGERGFTLIELLVVLAILGMLAAIATPQVIKYLGKAKADTARVEIKNIQAALDLFLIDIGRYPTQQEGLEALVANPSGVAAWRGPYLKTKGAPVDPWNHPYQYRYPGQHGQYDIFSLGADGAPGGTGDNEDLTSW
jgi:general secretion pathway protein G